MTQYKRIGIDTSKAAFTLHGIDQQDRPVLRINLRRAQMIAFFKQLVPTKMALEACGGAHYWARELTALGHEVRLIPPNTSNPLSNAARMTATTPRQSVKRRVGRSESEPPEAQAIGAPEPTAVAGIRI